MISKVDRAVLRAQNIQHLTTLGVYVENVPLPKGKHSCKYCYTTHKDWYDDGDHGAGVFVCGNCDYASVLDHEAHEAGLQELEKRGLEACQRRHGQEGRKGNLGTMTVQEVEDWITKRYPVSDKFSRAAREMVMGHWSRHYQAELLTVTCSKCRSVFSDCIRWTNSQGQVVDSWGFMEFSKSDRLCMRCDGQGWIGTMLIPAENKRRRPN